MKFVKRYVKIIRITMTIYREYLENTLKGLTYAGLQ